MKIEEAVALWLKDSTLRPRTLERYVYSLMQLARAGIETVEQLERESLRRHMTTRREQGITAQTCNRDLAAVCSLASWLEQRGEYPLERLLALRRLRMNTPKAPPPRFLSREEYATLRETSAVVSPVLALAVGVAGHTGMRLGELRTIHCEDFVLKGETPFVRVRRDGYREIKTGAERTTPIARAFADELVALDVDRREGPLFPSRPGGRGHITAAAYVAHPTLIRWLWIARTAAEQSKTTFHILRHSYASWCVQRGVPIAKVARWLGHSIQVCFRYYVGLVPGGDADIERGFADAAQAR